MKNSLYFTAFTTPSGLEVKNQEIMIHFGKSFFEMNIEEKRNVINQYKN